MVEYDTVNHLLFDIFSVTKAMNEYFHWTKGR